MEWAERHTHTDGKTWLSRNRDRQSEWEMEWAERHTPKERHGSAETETDRANRRWNGLKDTHRRKDMAQQKQRQTEQIGDGMG